jgi:hypothetical protein
MDALKRGCCWVRSMWRNFPACDGAVLVFMVYSFTRVPAVVGMKVENITNKANTGKCVCTKTAAPRDPGPSQGRGISRRLSSSEFRFEHDEQHTHYRVDRSFWSPRPPA